MNDGKKLSFLAALIAGIYMAAWPLTLYAQRSSSNAPNFQGGAGTRGQGPGSGPASGQATQNPARAVDEMRGRDLAVESEIREKSPGLGAAENIKEEIALTPLEARLQQARERALNKNKENGEEGSRIGRFFGDLFGHEGKMREEDTVEMGGQAWRYQAGEQGPGHWTPASPPSAEPEEAPAGSRPMASANKPVSEARAALYAE